MPRIYSGEHIRVWEAANGPVPPGHEVHHKNKNKQDDRLENLECLTIKEHWQKHHEERGADWHSKGGKAAWANRPVVDLVCVVCKEPFRSKVPTASTCSDECRATRFVNEHRGKQWVTKLCDYCGEPYQYRRCRVSRFCSALCRNKGARGSVLSESSGSE